MKKLTAIILTLIITFALPLQYGGQKAEAAVIYISVSTFAKALVNEMGLKPAETNQNSGYVNRLINVGVIKTGDFKSYSSNLTRGDMLVLLNRSDEYLKGTAVDVTLIQTVIDKRISDIKKAAVSKKEDTAEGYAKGFLKGYSNGAYSTSRNLKLTSKVTKTGALSCLKMLKGKSLRAKISPDGQLIRTTKLPNNAYMYAYILESYPNKYYESMLRFEGVTRRENGVVVPLISPKDFTYPVDIENASVSGISDINETKVKFLDMWMGKVYTHIWNVFNVDYRTIDDEWVETVAQTDASIINSSEFIYSKLERYVTEMKENKTIVNCDKVSMDASSLYFFRGMYYIRCYVHYRIKSTNTKTFYSADEIVGGVWGPYNSLLYTRTAYVNLENQKYGKWIDGVFDIGIGTGADGDNGFTYGVSDSNWSPGIFRVIERD